VQEGRVAGWREKKGLATQGQRGRCLKARVTHKGEWLEKKEISRGNDKKPYTGPKKVTVNKIRTWGGGTK